MGFLQEIFPRFLLKLFAGLPSSDIPSESPSTISSGFPSKALPIVTLGILPCSTEITPGDSSRIALAILPGIFSGFKVVHFEILLGLLNEFHS